MVINSLTVHTYHAVIRIRKERELIEIDSRSSDVIALSVHFTVTSSIGLRSGV